MGGYIVAIWKLVVWMLSASIKFVVVTNVTKTLIRRCFRRKDMDVCVRVVTDGFSMTLRDLQS